MAPASNRRALRGAALLAAASALPMAFVGQPRLGAPSIRDRSDVRMRFFNMEPSPAELEAKRLKEEAERKAKEEASRAELVRKYGPVAAGLAAASFFLFSETPEQKAKAKAKREEEEKKRKAKEEEEKRIKAAKEARESKDAVAQTSFLAELGVVAVGVSLLTGNKDEEATAAPSADAAPEAAPEAAPAPAPSADKKVLTKDDKGRARFAVDAAPEAAPEAAPAPAPSANKKVVTKDDKGRARFAVDK